MFVQTLILKWIIGFKNNLAYRLTLSRQCRIEKSDFAIKDVVKLTGQNWSRLLVQTLLRHALTIKKTHNKQIRRIENPSEQVLSIGGSLRKGKGVCELYIAAFLSYV